MRIKSEIRRIVDCAEEEREGCCQVLQQLFLGVQRQDFEADFREKEAVILLRNAENSDIIGFSTLMLLHLPLPEGDIVAVFSGDTAVLPHYRSSFGLGVEIGRYFLDVHQRYPDQPAYYILISKGWRTYRIMPFLFVEYAPCRNVAVSPFVKSILDAFGRKKYPARYDSTVGVIRSDGAGQRLPPDSSDAAAPQGDPDAQFFLQANPEYLRGDELICVASAMTENFTPQFRRLLGFGRGHERKLDFPP